MNMTREEIENMSAGREMDMLVGERVMGWEYNQLGDAWIREGQSFLGCDRFQPSFDIAAAWMVIKHFNNQCMLNNVHGIWECYLPENVRSEARSAPLAICRAALIAVMETEKP